MNIQACPSYDNGWRIEIELMCINGLRAWFTFSNFHEPDEAETGYSEGGLMSAESRCKQVLAALSQPTTVDRSAVIAALNGMLMHSAVHDADPEDTDPEDKAAESAARALIRALGAKP